jgi:hypothetical protein
MQGSSHDRELAHPCSLAQHNPSILAESAVGPETLCLSGRVLQTIDYPFPNRHRESIGLSHRRLS